MGCRTCLAMLLTFTVASWGMRVPHVEVDSVLYGQQQNDLLTVGDNHYAQLGLGQRLAFKTPTSPSVSGFIHQLRDKYTHLVTGCDADHALAISEDGVLVGWGRNDEGQLGFSDGFFTSVTEAPRVLQIGPNSEPVSQAVVGTRHSIVLTRHNNLYRLMGGSVTLIPFIHKIVRIAAGDGFSLFTSKDGNAFLLENGSRDVEMLRAMHGFVVSVAACGKQAVALNAEGRAFTWGDNSYGQLCAPLDVPAATHLSPYSFEITLSSGAAMVSAKPAPNAMLLLTEDGNLLECSTSSPEQSGPKPFQLLDTDSKVLSYSPGLDHTMIVLASGEVLAYGNNQAGQQGEYDVPDYGRPLHKVEFTGYADRKYTMVGAGDKFSVLLAECEESTCVHGVSSPTDNCKCLCERFWKGANCDVCARNSSFCFAGTLNQQKCGCDCVEPWMGDRCMKCGLECGEHGKTRIQNKTCTCSCQEPWGGDLCNVCTKSRNDCFVGELNRTSCACECKEPWGGEHCNKCTRTDAYCKHGKIDMDTCECICDFGWMGAQCDKCGIAAAHDEMCLDVDMYNSLGEDWSDHELFLKPITYEGPTISLGFNATLETPKVCVKPAVYEVFACGLDASVELGIGWSVGNIMGGSSLTCGDGSKHLVVNGGGCNQGTLDEETCSCSCTGNWHGGKQCHSTTISMWGEFGEAWEDNVLVFEDSDGFIVKKLQGSTGTRQICLEPGVYKGYVCGSSKNISLDATSATQLKWKIDVSTHIAIEGTGYADEFCDVARATSSVTFNVTELLTGSWLSADIQAALVAEQDGGTVTMIRSNSSTLKNATSRPQYCHKCDYVNKCEHGKFLGDCSCTCDEPWIGSFCDECGLVMGTMTPFQARIDMERCEVHCVGGWQGDACNTCAIDPNHCDGTMNRSACVCMPFYDSVVEGVPIKQCRLPWTGPDCSVCPRTDDFCKNDGILKSCNCDCRVPWMGESCESCALTNSTCNHGVKAPEDCACDCIGGWDGRFCTECSLECGVHGAVNESCYCTCEAPWSGETCDVCGYEQDKCGEHGTLSNETCACECEDGWAGEFCTVCTMSGCVMGNLNVDTCSCECFDLWDGKLCTQCTKPESDCYHGSLDNSSCSCSCDQNWAGEACDACTIGEHECAHGVFEAELCQCICPLHRSGKLCQHCDLTPAACGGFVNMDHCTCNHRVEGPKHTVVQHVYESTDTENMNEDHKVSSAGTSQDYSQYDGKMNLTGLLPFISYGADTEGAEITLPTDYSVKVRGGAWRALKLETPYVPSADTHLEFDLTVPQLCDHLEIALIDEDTEYDNQVRIGLARIGALSDPAVMDITDQMATPSDGETKHYNILVRRVYDATVQFTHVVFVHACSDARGMATFDKLALYEGSHVQYRADMRCGSGFLGPNGGTALCSFDSPSAPGRPVTPCCSADQHCGSTPAVCDCDTCVDNRVSGDGPEPFVFTTSPPSLNDPNVVYGALAVGTESEDSVTPSSSSGAESGGSDANDAVEPLAPQSEALSSLEDKTVTLPSGNFVTSGNTVAATGSVSQYLSLSASYYVKSSSYLTMDVKIDTVCSKHIVSLQNTDGSETFFRLAGTDFYGDEVDAGSSIGSIAGTGWQSIKVPIGLSKSQGRLVHHVGVHTTCVPSMSSATMSLRNIVFSDAILSADLSVNPVSLASDDTSTTSYELGVLSLSAGTFKAIALSTPTVVGPSTTYEFDLLIEGSASDSCRVSAGVSTSSADTSGMTTVHLKGSTSATAATDALDYAETDPYVGGWKHYSIPIGLVAGVASTLSMADTLVYVVLQSECDTKVANIHVSDLTQVIHFSDYTLYSYDQDKDEDPAVVKSTNTITLSQSAWKGIRIPTSFLVTTTSHLDFDFKINEMCERHGIALMTNLDSSQANKNLYLTGTEDPTSAAEWYDYSAHQTYESGWTHYRIPLAGLYEGSFDYLGFINDCECAYGQACTGSASFANVVLR